MPLGRVEDEGVGGSLSSSGLPSGLPLGLMSAVAYAWSGGCRKGGEAVPGVDQVLSVVGEKRQIS
jgi:hypothetical protein